MSRCSKYNQQDIERMADENGYKYISGIQANQESEHVVRCRMCGLPDKKTTKMLIAHSKCRYMPCKNYVASITLAGPATVIVAQYSANELHVFNKKINR